MSSIQRVRELANRLGWRRTLIAVASFFVPLAGFIIVAQTIETRADERSAQIEQLQAAIGEIDKQIEAVNALDEQRQRLLARLQIAEAVSREVAVQARVLWTASQFPAGVAVRQLDVASAISIQAESQTNGELARSAAQLAQTSGIEHVRIDTMSSAPGGLVDFTLSAQTAAR